MIPNVNVWSVDSEHIYLNWKVQDRDTIKAYNLYGCDTSGGSYTLVQESVPNNANPMSPGSVLAKVSRSDLSITADAPYFFKITSIDMEGSESSIASSDFVAVDALDDVFRNRWTDDNSPVYSSKTVTLAHTTTNQLFNVVQILGRQANYMRITTSKDITIRINSPSNDPILVTKEMPFFPDKHAISASSIYFSTVSENATVQVFVSGN
jgi:hypothetical protein